MTKDLFKFEEVRQSSYGGSYSFFFGLDCSSNMDVEIDPTGRPGVTRFDTMVSQVRLIVTTITQMQATMGLEIGLGFSAFGSTATGQIFWDYSISDFEELNEWIDNLQIRTGGPDFERPLSLCDSFNDGYMAGYTNTAFFIMGDEPNPTGSASTGATTYTDLINGTGYYSSQPVDIYGLLVDLTDTQYIDLITNQDATLVDTVVPNTIIDPIMDIINATVNDVIETNTFTSSDASEDYDGDTYAVRSMGRTVIDLDNEINKDQLKVSFSVDDTFANPWFQKKSTYLMLRLFEIDDNGDVSRMWRGRLANVEAKGNEVALVFESAFTLLRRFGLNWIYQRSCSHTLYGYGCNLLKSDWAVSGTIRAINGNELDIDEAFAYTSQYFTLGTVEGPDGEIVFIEDHTTDKITVDRVPDAWQSLPYNVTLYPGCTKGAQTCIDKFDNILNHGGFPHMPQSDPFEKTHII